jgi:hypothetical protein
MIGNHRPRTDHADHTATQTRKSGDHGTDHSRSRARAITLPPLLKEGGAWSRTPRSNPTTSGSSQQHTTADGAYAAVSLPRWPWCTPAGCCACGAVRRPRSRSWPPGPTDRALAVAAVRVAAEGACVRSGGRSRAEVAASPQVRGVTPNEITGEVAA